MMINYPDGRKYTSAQTPPTKPKKSKYADFTYNDLNGQLIVEDAKGVKTPVYRLKRRMMAEKYGIEIKET